MPGAVSQSRRQVTKGRKSMALLNHFDESGKAVMADVTEKEATRREAAARGRIVMSREAFQAVQMGTAKKGDVLGVGRIAGIMAAKRAWETIPLCHPLGLTSALVDFTLDEAAHAVEAVCVCRLNGKTGVEMEALAGVSAALLTIYDMVKSIDKAMVIEGVCLCHKTGGKSGDVFNAQR